MAGFQFKQFSIAQEACAQKVSEVACVFGAWAEAGPEAGRALDIGAGTGLLSLMLAQRFPSLHIDAVEIEPACAEQLKRNVQASPFAAQVHAHCADILDYTPVLPYDLIICNPPFFEKQLQSPKHSKNAAWHSTHLTLSALLDCCARMLRENGQVFLLLLPERRQEVTKAGWFVRRAVDVAHSATHKPKVVMLEIRRENGETREGRLDLHAGEDYSAEAGRLLSPYYLKL
jgi:tRNA1Val (adenine37-N6)-methyltransferase